MWTLRFACQIYFVLAETNTVRRSLYAHGIHTTATLELYLSLLLLSLSLCFELLSNLGELGIYPQAATALAHVFIAGYTLISMNRDPVVSLSRLVGPF